MRKLTQLPVRSAAKGRVRPQVRQLVGRTNGNRGPTVHGGVAAPGGGRTGRAALRSAFARLVTTRPSRGALNHHGEVRVIQVSQFRLHRSLRFLGTELTDAGDLVLHPRGT